MTPEELEENNRQILRIAELESLPTITFNEFLAVVNKWYIVPDRGIAKLLCAFLIANRLQRKALWLAVIAPSGGGKTALFDAFAKIPDIYSLSMLTPNTFLSGMPGKKDPSLLPRISGKILMMKDFTSILSMNWEARSEIFGQLREIWDGGLHKEFGNGVIRDWVGKMSLLAASTQAFDLNQQQTTHLGERFLMYRPIMPDRKEVARRALSNDSKREEMMHELENAAYAFWKGINWDNVDDYAALVPEKAKEEIIDLSDFITRGRSGVIRESSFKQNIMFVPTPEMPPRMATQLLSALTGLIGVNGGKFLEEDMSIIHKLAFDSVPSTNWMVIREMARGDHRTTADIATSTGYPSHPIRLYLENLAAIEVADRQKAKDVDQEYRDGDGVSDRWTLKESFRDLVRKYQKVNIIHPQTDEEKYAEELDEYLGAG